LGQTSRFFPHDFPLLLRDSGEIQASAVTAQFFWQIPKEFEEENPMKSRSSD